MSLRIADATELTAADVVHTRVTAMPATASVAEIRAWFEESTSHRLAVLADGERFAGMLTPEDLAPAGAAGADGRADEASTPATTVARMEPTIGPDEPAGRAQEMALATEVRRVVVVDGDGRLVGVVAITPDLASFCGAPER